MYGWCLVRDVMEWIYVLRAIGGIEEETKCVVKIHCREKRRMLILPYFQNYNVGTDRLALPCALVLRMYPGKYL